MKTELWILFSARTMTLILFLFFWVGAYMPAMEWDMDVFHLIVGKIWTRKFSHVLNEVKLGKEKCQCFKWGWNWKINILFVWSKIGKKIIYF